MRLSESILVALIAAVAASCTSDPQTATAKIDQSGNLKVNPELLGKRTATGAAEAKGKAAPGDAGRQRQD